jgi:glycerol-3-phosphate cytidylyltransferase-like family protein
MKKFMFAAIAAMVMVSVSNAFASSRMVGNAEVAPVDTVAPDAPADTTEVGTPIQPQAITEDSNQQETTQQQAIETEQQTNAE